MPTPVSLSAWLDRGHDDDTVLVHHDRYFVPDDPRSPLAELVDELLEGLPDEERRAVEAVVLTGMSYRDAAEALDVRLASGVANKKRVYRVVQRALGRLRDDLERRAPWLAAFMSDPGLLGQSGAIQGALL